MTIFQLGLIAVFAPLAAAVVLLLVRPLRHSGLWGAALSIFAAWSSFAAATVLLGERLQSEHIAVRMMARWLPAAGETIGEIGIQLDGISIPMLVVVSLVALCVQVYSLGYMADEPAADQGRYFAFHSLFLFSMQGLVVAPNMLQLFACWELVGLCSYLLIGFYYRKPSAARAALKAFWVTKLADVGLLLGLILHFVAAGSFGWDPATVAGLDAAGRALPWVAILYFIGVMGKSAQFPLHIWLPDAMEGPTPVSALLHAATMVAAGVYLVVRAWPIFEAAEVVLPLIAVVGGVTALFAAVVAVVQDDIKRVLAYSTCSQLGYMIAGLGAGSLAAGYFHLTTHAFFKALLFLAAGSVIHAVHTNDMTKMGGLLRKQPVTAATFIIGSLALAGLPFLSGFYSKDLILESLWHAVGHDQVYWLPFLCCTAAVALTAFYMGRAVWLTFFGEASPASEHAHESEWSMRGPLLVLAAGSIAVGWAGGYLSVMWDVYHDWHFAVFHFTPVGILAAVLAIGGIVASWLVYRRGAFQGAREGLAPVAEFIRWGAVDRAWLFAYQRGVVVASAGLGWFDRYVVDGLMNAVGAGLLLAGERLRRMQTGLVSDYAYAVLIGVMALAAWGQIWFRVGAS